MVSSIFVNTNFCGFHCWVDPWNKMYISVQYILINFIIKSLATNIGIIETVISQNPWKMVLRKRQFMDCNYWFYEKIISIYLLESELTALNEVLRMITISGTFNIILINYVNDFLCLNQAKIFSLITYEWYNLEHKNVLFSLLKNNEINAMIHTYADHILWSNR